MRHFAFPRAGAAAALLALLAAIAPNSSMAAPHAASLAPPALLATGAPTRARRNVNGIPDTGQFLPDSAVVARVDEKAFTALDFAWNYYNSYPADRPKPDSLGRVEFLNTLISKEVLGRTAKKVGYDIGFEGRVQLRDYTQRVASNVLFRRAVIDSVVVTEQDVHRVYDQFKTALRVHRILFVDRATAERVRRDLIAGRVSWSAAVKKYSQAIGDHEDGDIGWVRRAGLTLNVAEQVYATKLGEVSQVVVDETGPQLIKIVETRADNPPAFDAIESLIHKQLFAAGVDKRAGAIQDLLAGHAKFRPDTANILWACKFFPDPKKIENKDGRATLAVDATIPEFGSTDTSRVLARWKDGSITLNRFLIEYGEISPISRPLVNTPESMTAQVANIALEPYKEQLAIARGYDKDPSYIYQVETQREKLLVERMYADSVTSRVRSTPEERKAEFEKHKDRYAQLETRHYATILRLSQASADSLAGLLRAGASAESVIAADARAGFQSGAVHDLKDDDHGPFKKIVYEELKPGGAEVIATDQPGKFAVVQLLTVTPRHDLSYKEAEEMVYANVEADKSEALLHEWLARLKKQHKITARPELVMKIRLVDPTI